MFHFDMISVVEQKSIFKNRENKTSYFFGMSIACILLKKFWIV